jgi:hypothetical protein
MKDGLRPGYFYVVQLLPDLAPNRLKFGFAQDLANRLWGYKTSSPHAEKLAAYPSLSSDEHTAIATVTGPADRRLTAEIFEVASVEATLKRVAQFFEWTAWVDEGLYQMMFRGHRDLAVDYLTDIRDPGSTLRQSIHSESHGLRTIRIA